MAIFSKTKDSPCISRPGVSTPRTVKIAPDERKVRAAMLIGDPEREQFIEELKRSVWSGAYDPDPLEIADAIVTERMADRELAV